MHHMKTKLFIGGIALITAISYLAFAGLKDGWIRHVQVDEFVQNSEMRSQRVQLVGKVSADGLDARPAKLIAKFNLAGESTTLPVVYRGAIPDLFKADSEVIVEGRVDATGVFQADVLMTKCASKYQAEEHANRNKEM